jgi:hypothetical protein
MKPGFFVRFTAILLCKKAVFLPLSEILQHLTFVVHAIYHTKQDTNRNSCCAI